MGHFASEEFGAVVRDGMLQADETYLNWTGGWGLAEGGIEGFLTGEIARQIITVGRQRWGSRGSFIALELSLDRLAYDLAEDDRSDAFREALDKERSQSVDVANGLLPQSRIDLVYYDGYWPGDGDKMRPRGVVEVKRWFDKSTYPKDMRRIGALLRSCGPSNGGSLLCGCFVFFIFERDRARQKIDAAVENIIAQSEKFREYSGCDFAIATTKVSTSDNTPAKAASVTVVFQAPGAGAGL